MQKNILIESLRNLLSYIESPKTYIKKQEGEYNQDLKQEYDDWAKYRATLILQDLSSLEE